LTVRPEWLREVNRRSQEFVGRLLPNQSLIERQDLETFVRKLPVAAGAAEATLLKARLLELTLRWSAHAHQRFHGSRSCSCLFKALEPLAGTWRVDPEWDARIAAQWTEVFAPIGDGLRNRENARRLAALIAEQYRAVGTVAALVEQLSADPRRLAKAFRDEFGCTPHAYLTRVRVAQALDLLGRGVKVEAVALDVGYRSKKDLFQSLRKLTGLLPSDVRRLTRAERSAIFERLATRPPADRPGC
jgi:AraC-like DNA-binding protein